MERLIKPKSGFSQAQAFMEDDSNQPERILVIEDEPELADLIVDRLTYLPAAVELAGDGELGLTRVLRESWHALVLDIRLPGRDGLWVCRQIRACNPDLPIMMLTAMASHTDRVLGLESGADDYLCKPFSVIELQARMRALLRRGRLGSNQHEFALPAAKSHLNNAGTTALSLNKLRIDRLQHRVWSGDKELNLTPLEFDLLWTLMGEPARVFSRSELLDLVWGGAHEGFEHTVNTHLHRLRAKLTRCGEPCDRIENVWGKGYRLKP